MLMQHQWDLVVVGAGPSGLNAASAAAENGLEVLLVDEQEMPGGQIYRKLPAENAEHRFLQAEDRKNGTAVIQRFYLSGAQYQPNTTVWFAEPGRILCSRDGESQEIKAQYLVVATGAMERPVPFKGWTLPGVLGAGAADILHKDAGIPPQGPVVIAGNGPLIPLAASHLIEQGVEIAAILDTAPMQNKFTSMLSLPPALRDIPFLLKGAQMMAKVLLSKTKTITGVKSFAALGEDKLEKVSAVTEKGPLEFEAATLLVHNGVIPRTHFSRMMRMDHAWDNRQRYWYPKTDKVGHTSLERVYVVGDTAFVHGAQASALKGSLAGIDVALQLKMIDATEAARQSKPVKRELTKALAPRGFADAFFAPAKDLYAVEDDTLVCRCEGVTAGEIRQAVSEGCHEVNDIKTRTRCGMGPCQGRMCGPALAEIAAMGLDRPVPQVGSLNIRPPVRPIPFKEICSLAPEHKIQ